MEIAAAITILAVAQVGVSEPIPLETAAFENGSRRLNLGAVAPQHAKDRSNRLYYMRDAIELTGPWRYAPGDDPARSARELDDTAWEHRSTNLADWTDDQRFDQIGWF